MPEANNARDNEYVTSLTLKINFKELTFKDLTTRERIISRSSKPPCICSRLYDAHPYHGVQDVAQGLRRTEVVTARFVMISDGKARQAVQLCNPDAGLVFQDPQKFRLWMLSLVLLLSELCEGDHASGPREPPPMYGLRPFKDGKVSKRVVCEELRRLLITPLTPSENKEHGMGYIYILRSRSGSSTLGELKIGFSKYHPEHRAHEIASCYAQPEVVSHTPLIPHARRLESIIHMELQSIRKVHACRKCKGNHREWFTIKYSDSREVIMRWCRWVLQQPYVIGNLTQEWKTYLASKDFGSVDEGVCLATLWQSILNDFPRKGSDTARIATYLNQCHWNNICTESGVEELEKVGKCENCRRLASNWRKLKRSPFPKSAHDVDAVVERLGRMGLGGDNVPGPCKCGAIPDADFVVALGFALQSESPSLDLNQPLRNWADKIPELGRIVHPATPARYLLGLKGSSAPMLDLLQKQQNEEESARNEYLAHVGSKREIKTGARSVDDPRVVETESPLGDATLLPVIALKEFDEIGIHATEWIGYTPTHCGFQFLQEGYKEGKWSGKMPQFKPPKSYEKGKAQAVPMSKTKHGPNSDTEKGTRSEVNGAAAIPDNTTGHATRPDLTFKLNPGPDFGNKSFTFDTEFTPMMDGKQEEYLEQMQKISEIPLGRQMLEEKFIRLLRRSGVGDFYDLPEGSDDSTADESSSSDREYRSASRPPIIPAKRAVSLDPQGSPFSAKKMKRWMEEM